MLRILVILLLVAFTSLSAQVKDSTGINTPKEIVYDLDSNKAITKFDTEQINEFKADDDFDYTEYEETDNIWTRFKSWLGQQWIKFLHWLFGVEEVTGFWAVVLQILPYLVIVAVVLLLIRLFMRVNPGDMLFEKQEAPQVALTEDEDIIQNQDIQQLIHRALSDKNYRLAIRYYYLMVLKKLSDQEFIEWESQKTNTDYLKELKDRSLQDQFGVITRLYDFIWYGSFDVDEKSYLNAEKKFISITKAIQS